MAEFGAPVTLLYAGLLGLFMALLSIRVPMKRGAIQATWGDAGDNDLATRIRVFGNFVEYVPAILVLMLLLELSGAPFWALHLTGGATLAARLVHALSLNRDQAKLPWRMAGRFFGAFVTWLALSFAAGYCLYLALA